MERLIYSVLAVLFASYFVSGQKDPSAGLNCVTLEDDSKTKVCTGANSDVTKLRDSARQNKSAVDGLDIQTRFFRPPCAGENSCTAFQSTYAPTLMKNKRGQDRYIYQDEDFGFAQNIRVVTCNGGPCGRGGKCEQAYRDYYLISWDAAASNSWYNGPIVDTFSVPDCCRCGRARPGWRPQIN